MKHHAVVSTAGLLAFAAGIAMVMFVPVLPDWRYLAPAVVLALILLRRPSVAPLGCLVLGMTWHCFYGQSMLAAEIPAPWEGRLIMVEGRVKGLVHSVSEPAVHQRFQFEVLRASYAGRPLRVNRPLLLRLTAYPPRKPSAVNNATDNLVAPNQRWQLALVLQRPRGLANPGTFDYRLWLLSRGFGGSGKVIAHEGNRLLGYAPGPITTVRRWYQEQLQRLLNGREQAALVMALAIGERQQLSRHQREVLAATGTAHLMVISGLHVGLCALFGFVVGYLIFALSPAWVECGRALLWARIAALVLATLYAGMAGFALPTQRALIMLLLFLLARQSGREVAGLRGWLLAFVLVLLQDPLAVAAAGFWLSFTAVFLLMMPLSTPLTRQRWQLPALHTQCRLSLGLCPLLALWGGQLSVIAPLVNLLAIPFVGFLVVPLLLATMLVLPFSETVGALLLEFACQALALCWQGLEWATSASAQWSSLPMYPTPVSQLLGLLAVLLFMLPRGTAGRIAWPLLLLPMLWPAPSGRRGLDVYMLDVGQGTSVVVRVDDNVLVYDAGPAYASGFNAGDAVLVPFLRRLGVSRVDRLIVSHSDLDHSGGARALMDNMVVASWMAPGSIAALGSPDTLCRAGEAWQWGEVRFSIVYPEAPLAPSSNNRSCVLLIETTDVRYLLAGDIERSAEQVLTRALGPRLAADVLLVPHHGSGGSSSWDFAWFVNPRWAVISSGHGNHFGHPHPRVVRRYQELGAEVINTAESGALLFSAAEGYLPYRWFYTRYWRNYPCNLTASASAPWRLARVWWPEGCVEPPHAVHRSFL